MKKYHVEITAAAEAELREAYLWIREDSPERAARWRRGHSVRAAYPAWSATDVEKRGAELNLKTITSTISNFKDPRRARRLAIING